MTGPPRSPDEAEPVHTIIFNGRRFAPWPELEGALRSLAGPSLPPSRGAAAPRFEDRALPRRPATRRHHLISPRHSRRRQRHPPLGGHSARQLVRSSLLRGRRGKATMQNNDFKEASTTLDVMTFSETHGSDHVELC